MPFKYTSTFTAVAKVVAPTEQDRFVAKASLEPLKGLLPADVNPADSPDLLFISCNGAVGGLVNRNGDAVSCETALAIYKSAQNKYITTDHDREKPVGVVLYPGLSTFGTNQPLTEEAAAALKEPFNMAFVGALWKTINPMLSKYIANDGAVGEDSLSMSWEISFNSYSIGVGSQNLFDAKIIAPDDASFAAYDGYLRVNKGEGKDPSGNAVFRVIGDDSIILGYSIVARPAAHVEGILPLNTPPVEVETADDMGDAASTLSQIPLSQRALLEEQTKSVGGFHLCDITMEDGAIHEGIPVIGCRYIPKSIDGSKVASITICKKSEEKNITASNDGVNLDTAKLMPKITNLSELEVALNKHEAAAAVSDFVKAIQQGSDKYVADLAAKDEIVKTSEAARIASENRAKELQASIDAVSAELAAVKAQAEAVEVAQKFQERMAAFDETFDLDAEDVKLIASDIKDLEDEAFASYMAKAKKLMAAKAKKAKTDKKDDDKDNDDDDKDGKKAKAAAADKLIKEAVASIVADKGQTIVRDPVIADVKLVDDMAAAFGDSFKINGNSVKPSKK